LLSEHFTQTRRGVFQLDPILETFLTYYSSSGIMELLPTEDPGPGNLLSSAEYILYTTKYSNLTLVERGEWVEAGLLCCEGLWWERTRDILLL